MAEIVGIDVGGSGIKGALVNVAAGQMVSKRHRIETPQPATPDAVFDTIEKVLAHFDWSGPIGCAVPAVVIGGVVKSAANIDTSWVHVNAEKKLRKRIGHPVLVLNDADAAGLAEMRFGAGRGERGVVLMLTFGTGIGSALFVDGLLVPNLEMGHAQFRGMDAEHYAAARLVERDEMKLDWWAGRVNEFLEYAETLMSPDVIIFGGGISKRFDEFSEYLDTRARLVPAHLRNNAGIVGAALAAAESLE